MLTDPIADMLTRIRNGIMAAHLSIELLNSKLKAKIAEILKTEGYIEDYSVLEDRLQGVLKIYLKYTSPKHAAIAGIRRESKPGRRVYVGSTELPKVRKGLGVAVVSTSRGVMTDAEARKQGVGGELLFTVW